MSNSWINMEIEFKGRILGKLLGDGSIVKQRGRKPRFKFNHKASDFEWSLHCYNQLKEYIALNPPKFKIDYDKRLKNGYSTRHYTQSKTANVITFLYSKWYPYGKKVLPYGLIKKYFNEECLAWWYMDDGNLKQASGKPEKIILSTDNFTNLENRWLITFLDGKYDLKFNLDGQNRLVLYNHLQIHYFFFLVKPYMHFSMYRKAIKLYTYKFNIPSRRTTIYLPNYYVLQRPTSEINQRLTFLENIIKNYKNGSFYQKYMHSLSLLDTTSTKSYQIILKKQNIENLQFLKEVTGISYSIMSSLCFMKYIQE